VEEANEHPEVFAGKTVGQVADHLQRLIGSLTRKPAIISHSFGGLLTQILAGRGLSAASVAIDPAPFRGVLPLPISSLRAAAPVLTTPANRNRAVPLTYDQFRYSFANAVSEEEAKELYETFAVPAPGAPLFQAAAANLNPWTEVKADTENPDRGPLLIVSGEKDHTVPWALSHASFKKQQHNAGITEIVEVKDRGHALTIDHGRQEVADTALSFVRRFVRARSVRAPCLDHPDAWASVAPGPELGQGVEVHAEPGALQLPAYLAEPEGPVVHHERRPPQGVAHPHHGVEAEQHPEGRRGRAGRREHGEREPAARSQHSVHLGEEARQLAGQEVPERAEADDEVEGGRERQRAGVRTHPGHAGPGRMRALAGHVEHARAEVDPGDAAPAHRRQHVDPGAGAAAQVEAVVVRARPAQGRRHRVQDGVGGAEGRVVELRREQVVAVLDGRQRLDGEFAQRGAFGAEHPRQPISVG
jgi:hypothetical protein